jgi:hypothetical protein
LPADHGHRDDWYGFDQFDILLSASFEGCKDHRRKAFGLLHAHTLQTPPRRCSSSCNAVVTVRLFYNICSCNTQQRHNASRHAQCEYTRKRLGRVAVHRCTGLRQLFSHKSTCMSATCWRLMGSHRLDLERRDVTVASYTPCYEHMIIAVPLELLIEKLVYGT